MLTIIQSRSWRGFQQCLQILPSKGKEWMVATPPDLTFQTLQPELLRSAPPATFCIQTNIQLPRDTYMIARDYGKLLLCGTYLMNLQSNEIVKTELIEEDGSPTLYLR